MLNKILSAVMITAIIVAIIIGLFFRQTYTNITAEPNFMENHFSVALWDLDMSPSLIDTMRNDLPNSNLIIRAKSEGPMDYTFKNNKQHIEVVEVYQGDDVDVGDQIAITLEGWMFFFDDMTANLNFVNVMQPDHEYLIFLDQKIDSPDPKENNIYSLGQLIIPGIFNYEDQNHTIINVPEDYPYVPYREVKDNEFFISSEKALEALMELKHEFLQQYPR